MRLNNNFKSGMVDRHILPSCISTQQNINGKYSNLSGYVNHNNGLCYECNEYSASGANICAKNSSHTFCSLSCQIQHSC